MSSQPNVIIVLSDQHRSQATGYAGNPDVSTPNLDHLSREAVTFSTAVSTLPVCTPARASLLTGTYPLTHGLIVNDVQLDPARVSIADAFKAAGYNTAYIGKWHLDGGSWSGFIPPERRQGFDFWRGLECTHDYTGSHYHDDDGRLRKWEGYDAFAQTEAACDYIRRRAEGTPFLLVLAWGPPHDPYGSAPECFQKLYEPAGLSLRPNVPAEMEDRIRADLAGYYAHISALDKALGNLLVTIHTEGLEDETLVVYTSDHGVMLGSQGALTKERPWDESILVPLLLRDPHLPHSWGRRIEAPIGSPDIMPTLLDLCGVPIPDSVEGRSFAPGIRDDAEMTAEAALIECIQPFGSWGKIHGGREFRGVRTPRYTYVKDLDGPWLFYDNVQDPYQLRNLCGNPRYDSLQRGLDQLLMRLLHEQEDEFLPGEVYVDRLGYEVDETGRVPIVR